MSISHPIVATAKSHEGRVRANNEDAFCDRTSDGLWVVADGMGGHEFGERASAAIVAEVAKATLATDLHVACDAVSAAIQRANVAVWTEGQAAGVQMGSTVVALVVRDMHFAVLWVGDSRAYLMRGDKLYQLSRDHTQVQEMLDRGLLTEAEAVDHPMGHVLARAVGVREQLEIEAILDEVMPGDVFLLCSDGLSGMLSDDEIAATLRGAGENDVAAVDSLIAQTLDRGAPDNVTSIVVITRREQTILALSPTNHAVQP